MVALKLAKFVLFSYENVVLQCYYTTYQNKTVSYQYYLSVQIKIKKAQFKQTTLLPNYCEKRLEKKKKQITSSEHN